MLTIPEDSGLALIGDSDRCEVLPRNSSLLECLLNDILRCPPDFVGVMLHPPGARIDLLMFFLRAGDQIAVRIEDRETRAGRTLIDCADVLSHGRYSNACWSLAGGHRSLALAFPEQQGNDQTRTTTGWESAMQRMRVKTRRKREIVDITDRLQDVITKAYKGQSGFCQLSVLHTTAALTTADLDPGTDLDMLDAFEAIIPKLHYRHPHDPEHVPDHILSALIGTSVSVPVDESQLVLGTWQRVVLVELDGPRDREVVVSLATEKAA
jgi:secondary thiamine-phosphate synthase enzyme